MIVVAKLFLEFIIISFIGWLLEVIYGFFYLKKIVNRGFFVGPIIPIYGVCSIVMILLLGNLDKKIALIFFGSLLITTIIEYVTSFILEKTINIKLWDYKNMKHHLKGRVSLETLIPFGILGSLLILYIHPFFFNIIGILNDNVIYIISIIILIIMIIDFIYSLKLLKKIGKRNNDMDVTEIKSDYLVNEVNKRLKR